MKNAIEVKGLTKKYQLFTLEDISFTVPGGTIVGLIGENVPRYEQKTLSIT